MRALGSGIHTMAFELRARHRSGNELTRSLTGARTVECLKRQDGTQTQWIAAKDACHGVIHHEQRTGLASRTTQSAQIGHAQAKATDCVHKPPQVRPLSIKRGIKALGRGNKYLGARIPHQHNIAAIKATSKRIGKVVRKSHQAVTGTHNTQQRQRRRHVRGLNKTRITRASPYSPGLF